MVSHQLTGEILKIKSILLCFCLPLPYIGKTSHAWIAVGRVSSPAWLVLLQKCAEWRANRGTWRAVSEGLWGTGGGGGGQIDDPWAPATGGDVRLHPVERQHEACDARRAGDTLSTLDVSASYITKCQDPDLAVLLLLHARPSTLCF